MKYFIVGLHSSGKQEILDILSKYEVPCGKLFSNISEPRAEIYNSFNYELYTDKDIKDIFENNAYVFIQEIPCGITSESYKYFEGLSKYSLDNHDVFAISPDQFLSIVPNSINDDICFIWVDGTSINRRTRYLNEKCAYNFKERDVVESRDIQSFVKSLYSFKNSPVLYFANEEPARIATIIYTLIKHPELLELYSKTFN